ncbi:MAG: PaaI family thioesterase [Methyloligellaceae bacterium]
MSQSIFDKMKAPPAAELLGWKLISFEKDAGIIKVGFDGKREFTNPMGVIQGGFLSAMLDDTMGPLIMAMTDGKTFGQIIDLHVHFLRPMPVGPITGVAQVTKNGKRIAFLEGYLLDKDGNKTTRATASANIIEL